MNLRRTFVAYLALILTLWALASPPIYAADPQGEGKGGKSTPAPSPQIPDWVIYLILIGPHF
jgi:hypothetical protein